MHRFPPRSWAASLLLGATCWVGAADGPSLPLDAGIYVVTAYRPCNSAPFAGVRPFDGHSFSGPHASICESAILEHNGTTYRVKTDCQALGNGAPAPASSEVDDVKVKSRTAFVLTHDNRSLEFALCPAFH